MYTEIHQGVSGSAFVSLTYTLEQHYTVRRTSQSETGCEILLYWFLDLVWLPDLSREFSPLLLLLRVGLNFSVSVPSPHKKENSTNSQRLGPSQPGCDDAMVWARGDVSAMLSRSRRGRQSRDEGRRRMGEWRRGGWQQTWWEGWRRKMVCCQITSQQPLWLLPPSLLGNFVFIFIGRSITMVQRLNITTCCSRRETLRRRGRRSHALPPPLFPHPPSSAHVPAPALRLAAHPSLSRPRRTSFGGDDVAAVGVPLHVADAPDGLHLRAAGPKLVEVLEFALLQQVLVATVAGELVSHKPAGGGGREEAERQINNKK